MYEYDINMIPYDESKQIFEEIMVEFYSQKYRSCICNLNSLLYLDLIKKLEDLKNNMSDPKAKEILDELNQMNVNDELYSSCEKKLLDSCREKGYITKYFYEEALNLRKIRNRCAHPAFCGEPLFTPDKLETAMYIKKVFNELLIINNINYYNITNFVLDDIKDAYERGISVSNKSLKNRVKRLFSKCDEKNMQRLFNTLFDLSIIKNDDDCKKYRDYTYMYMKILIEIANSKNYIIVKENIKK